MNNEVARMEGKRKKNDGKEDNEEEKGPGNTFSSYKESIITLCEFFLTFSVPGQVLFPYCISLK